MLSKMAELLETLISWSLKTMLGAVLGLQAVRGLVAPAMDAIKPDCHRQNSGSHSGSGKCGERGDRADSHWCPSCEKLPGRGGCGGSSSGWCRTGDPYGVLSLSYRFLAAAAQPVSDKRIVGCLGTMGEGCAMLLRIMITAEVMCILTFVILMASVGG